MDVLTDAEDDATVPSPRRRALVVAFLILHLTAVVHSALSANKFYPPSQVASGFTSLERLEEALNRRDADTAFDRALQAYQSFVGVSQQWNTFAPVPPRMVSLFRVVAVSPAGAEEVVWASREDAEATGWFYSPNAKLAGMFDFRWPQFHENFAAKAGARAGFTPKSIRLEADGFFLTQGSEAGVRRETLPRRTLLTIGE